MREPVPSFFIIFEIKLLLPSAWVDSFQEKVPKDLFFKESTKRFIFQKKVPRDLFFKRKYQNNYLPRELQEKVPRDLFFKRKYQKIYFSKESTKRFIIQEKVSTNLFFKRKF